MIVISQLMRLPSTLRQKYFFEVFPTVLTILSYTKTVKNAAAKIHLKCICGRGPYPTRGDYNTPPDLVSWGGGQPFPILHPLIPLAS